MTSKKLICEYCDSDADYVVLYEGEIWSRSELKLVCKDHFQEHFEDNKAIIEIWTMAEWESIGSK